MAEAADRAGFGPMAAVGGAFSEAAGSHLMEGFEVQQLVSEKDNAIFPKIERSLLMPENSPLQKKTGIEIQASELPLRCNLKILVET